MQTLIDDREIDFGGGQVFVSQQLLDDLDIGTFLQQVGGEFVPHAVGVKAVKPRLLSELPYLVRYAGGF